MCARVHVSGAETGEVLFSANGLHCPATREEGGKEVGLEGRLSILSCPTEKMRASSAEGSTQREVRLVGRRDLLSQRVDTVGRH